MRSFLTLILTLTVFSAFAQQYTLKGKVQSASDDAPLSGATVKIKGSALSTQTDNVGNFSILTNQISGILTVSYIGFDHKEVPYDHAKEDTYVITLEPEQSSLDEVQVIGYGSVSKRFNTGSVVSVSAQEIERQPISNPLAALAGRVPGMTVVQENGNPGSKFNIQIRGQNSISQGSEPLFIIDGVPFPNNSIGPIGSLANSGQSPFANINPQDIESIDVLKDADATAIYGSRGANGVVLITTKKGKTGTTKVDALFNQSIAKVPKKLDLLNTQQYLAMRREAFANDGIEPTATNAPDLVLWDTTRYIDWQDYLIGGTAHNTNANLSLSGGNEGTQFIANANYNRQGSVFPGSYSENRGSARFNISHTSLNKRFKASITSSYSTDKNELPVNDLTLSILLPPNNPSLFDSEGNLNWSENGGTFSNPVTYLKRKNVAVTDNFLGNLNIQYELSRGLNIRLSGGYNQIQLNRTTTNPVSSQDPNRSSLVPTATFSNTVFKSFILEPQIEYFRDLGKGKLDILLGTTLQHDNKNLSSIDAEGFPSDALIEATAFATNVTAQTSKVEYRYQALFGRINYNYNGRYLINITGRRDGSSRFGPDKRISNFSAIGAAWIFSEELKSNIKFDWLSFGKIRGSYGITGNDQIGDYQYLDDYSAVRYPYQGAIGYIPSRLYNPDYTWERNRKLEAALELGFLDNRIQITTNWFRNRSNNQLIDYSLPAQTGFSSILRNFNALVQNIGWEWMISANPIRKTNFNWTISANLTVSRNKLLEFPELESSSYANTLDIGKPLNIVKLLHWTGVDPETGNYTFDGTSRPVDQTIIADFTPKYFGGVSNNVTYKNWDFNFLIQFTKQNGVNYLTNFINNTPGLSYNQPIEVLERWRNIGDDATIQKFTTTGSGIISFNNYAGYSDARISDASFLRLKTLNISYSLPNYIASKLKLYGLKFFYQGQNLWTITGYKGLDPETSTYPFQLPPLSTSSFGIQFSI
ncbi:SusC/RagA family TonB-linked outer membrane protein [Olivibacter jilunii]|uniref:SusC/RagA family TonB-linked outer membrane protein n=1 Tax=Olivibacter jilunii TaxID=985016 RepID=UPI0010308ACF|nr:SusC/RagA family TonB-linked outer membrane protein [Olivibacter jilunii]